MIQIQGVWGVGVGDRTPLPPFSGFKEGRFMVLLAGTGR